jgi:hypothetical protein
VIARFLNAAEAGYFAHELKLLRNIPVTLRAEEDFEALAGHGTTGFVLSVPNVWAEPAARTLTELVNRSESEEDLSERVSEEAVRDSVPLGRTQAFDPFAREDEFEMGPAIPWVPIVVTLAAGSLAFWGVKTLWEPARPPAPAPVKASRDVLWDVMRTPQGRKWVQVDPQGQPIRELEIEPAGTAAILREDHDGDQVFEHIERIKRP